MFYIVREQSIKEEPHDLAKFDNIHEALVELERVQTEHKVTHNGDSGNFYLIFAAGSLNPETKSDAEAIKEMREEIAAKRKLDKMKKRRK